MMTQKKKKQKKNLKKKRGRMTIDQRRKKKMLRLPVEGVLLKCCTKDALASQEHSVVA